MNVVESSAGSSISAVSGPGRSRLLDDPVVQDKIVEAGIARLAGLGDCGRLRREIVKNLAKDFRLVDCRYRYILLFVYVTVMYDIARRRCRYR